jgi:endonuclease YncB( thermonuclease family)
MKRWLNKWAAGVLVLTATPAGAQTVLDGDTLRYGGAIVHLWGVDAPEKGQVCADGWPAGQMAQLYLEGLVKGRKLTCDPKGAPGTPGGAFALCRVDGQDLSDAMAGAGMAWAVPAQTQDYTVADSNAMIAVLGVHAHDCMKAWEWRSREPHRR